MSNLNFDVFEGTSFQDLCKDVVDRSQNKKDQLDTLVSDIRTLIKTPNDVQVFMPRIKELIEIGIKNDEQLVKLIAVFQRLQSTQLETTGGENGGLSDEEKEQLMDARMRELDAVKEIKKETEMPIPKASSVTVKL